MVLSDSTLLVKPQVSAAAPPQKQNPVGNLMINGKIEVHRVLLVSMLIFTWLFGALVAFMFFIVGDNPFKDPVEHFEGE